LTLLSAKTVMFEIAFTGAALSVAGYLFSLLAKRVVLAKISTWILGFSFVSLTVYLLLAVIISAGFHDLGSRELFAFYAWSASGVYLAFQLKTKTRLLGAFVSPFVLLFMIAAAGRETSEAILPQNLQGWLATAHLAFAIVGEILFVLASCAAAMFIIQSSLLKSKKMGSMSRLLPPLNDLDGINHKCLLLGFPFLTVGIIGGAIYAAFVWEHLWPADPKVVWSFAAWVVYGFLLHQRLVIGWKGFRMATLSCAVFVLFLISALIIRFYLPTIHSFN